MAHAKLPQSLPVNMSVAGRSIEMHGDLQLQKFDTINISLDHLAGGSNKAPLLDIDPKKAA